MLEDIDNIKKDLQEYIKVHSDLIRLHTAENLSRIFSSVATSVIVGFFLLLILIFLSFAVGYFISSRLESDVLGFLSVAGIYSLILIIFLIFRKRIVDQSVIKAIIKLLFPKFSDDEKK